MKKVIIPLFFALSLIVPHLTYSSEKFSLKYKEAKDKDNPLLSLGWDYAQGSSERPAELKGIPKKGSKNLKYYRFDLADKEILFAIDAEDFSQTLYADTNMDNDLSDEKALTIKRDNVRSGVEFKDIILEIPCGKGKTKIAVSVTSYTYPRYSADFAPFLTGCYKGKIRLSEKVVDFAVADSNLDGRYDSFLQDIATEACDNIGIDIDKNRFFSDEGTNTEILPLCKILYIDNEYFSIVPAADGKSVTVKKANPKFGTLDVQNPNIRLSLISDNGPYELSGSGEKWQLPVGTYLTRSITLSKEDDKAVTWEISSSDITDNLSSFGISENKAVVLGMGVPLIVKTKVIMTGDDVSIDMSVFGQGGEEYQAEISRGREAQPAPKFKIVSREGKEILKDSFSYG